MSHRHVADFIIR